MESYILAHDLGTSGNKATLFSLDGELKGSTVSAYPTLHPFEGAVEQDPAEWWRAVCDSTRELLETTGTVPGQIACVSFSGIMMGCLLVDAKGDPVRNMLIWADTRSAVQERAMLDRVPMERGYRITGHRPSASYSAAKLLWVKDNEPKLYARAAKLLHAKDYLVYKFTGQFATDYSDASGTNLLDIEKRDWSCELLEAWDIRADLLPHLRASTDVVGRVTPAAAVAAGLLEGTPVVMGGGDGSCAAVGAGVVAEGNAYNVIGTSSWVSTAARQPYYDEAMRTFNWVHLDPTLITPCGTMQAAGFSYSWYRDVLCLPEVERAKAEDTSVYRLLDAHVAESPPGANGLLYLPYLLGERSPRWNHAARGAFIGMGASTTRSDFTRAVLEGVGYNLKTIIGVLEGHAPIHQVVTIGGGAKGRAWLQILADIWQKQLEVPRYIEEATSLGAAVCGGVGIGAYPDFTVAQRFNPVMDTLHPDPVNTSVYRKMYDAFERAYRQLVTVYELLAQ